MDVPARPGNVSTDLGRQRHFSSIFLRRRLWRGDVEGAVRVIGEEVPRARPGSSLATFGEYLRARRRYIPDYRTRWRARR
ncbi:MAG: hypothetical protein JWO59_1478 [Chloroflexi bacterium]|nr:hypothetical protein [Chloroflexota bacterium]